MRLFSDKKSDDDEIIKQTEYISLLFLCFLCIITESLAELHHSSSGPSIHTSATQQTFFQCLLLAALCTTIILFVSNSNQLTKSIPVPVVSRTVREMRNNPVR